MSSRLTRLTCIEACIGDDLSLARLNTELKALLANIYRIPRAFPIALVDS